jgi:hypothetical protein
VVVQVVACAVAAGGVPARWCSGGQRRWWPGLFFFLFVFEKTFAES